MVDLLELCVCLEQVKVESGEDLGNLMNWIGRVPHNVSVLVMKNSTFFGRRNPSLQFYRKEDEDAPTRSRCSDAVFAETQICSTVASSCPGVAVDVVGLPDRCLLSDLSYGVLPAVLRECLQRCRFRHSQTK